MLINSYNICFVLLNIYMKEMCYFKTKKTYYSHWSIPKIKDGKIVNGTLSYPEGEKLNIYIIATMVKKIIWILK